jgi:hypothetical protein
VERGSGGRLQRPRSNVYLQAIIRMTVSAAMTLALVFRLKNAKRND